ncbi:spore gernimation protein [Bacillus sp. HMF5848]|uniref:GerAB/ArcD/ProY family transporter n=1 Tax=Bacillus sp. HMF5848 TaxID=2495421 RepID=UPI000F7B3C48|nr:GerAB/ArcD/ProY family transporter [Bacillus sp. HMF5848]RSK25635.1 spore gernimation protein [Bacillus sp. HMF5848]
MKTQITNGMFMAIIINMVYAKGIGLTQGSMAREVGRDIWLSSIIGNVLGLLLMLLVVAAIKRLPKGDLIHQGEFVLGTFFSKLLGVLFFLFFLGSFAVVMMTFVYHLKDYFLPEAPTWIFVTLGLAVGVYAIHFGIEVVSRMALIGVFSVLSLNILLLLGSFGRFDIRELLPVLESGLLNTIWASRHYLADWAITAMMAGLILPIVKDSKTWYRSATLGVLFGGGFILMWPILEVGVLSANVTGQYIVSCMQMARSAQIGLYIHRYEMIMVAFFALSILTQIMISLFCASVAAQKVFSAKDYRPFIIPVSLILGGFSYWYILDHYRAISFLENEWIIFGLGVAIAVPLFLWMIGFVFRKKLKELSHNEDI